MTSLILGVVDIAYDNRDGGKATTTAKVAQWLEAKYGVMEKFFEAHKTEIAANVVSSLEGALEDLYAGAPPRDPFADATQKIMTGFRTFLMTGEIERMGVTGVPTQAAIDRRSLRFKSKKSDHARPSFIDTSTYELAMRAWMDD